MMDFRQTRELSWAEWREAVNWLLDHWREIVVLERNGEPCEKHVLKLSTMGLNGWPVADNRAYTVRGPDDLVVEFIMRWG